MERDTIAAIATGSVRCAVGIVRLSGPGAIPAAEHLFRAANGKPLREAADRQLVYGTLLDGEGRPVDQILATISRGPHSYTGEDTAELQCHGSPAVLGLALEGLYAQGVRPAGPGEFTRRAFLNGRLDLLQAEAVADLIDAGSAVSGCGPAYVYLFAEALADGGVACGLPRDKALTYAAQTLAGAARLILESGKHPGQLKDAVCSPGGSTIQGVRKLETGGLRGTVMEAVLAAFEKNRELGKQ